MRVSLKLLPIVLFLDALHAATVSPPPASTDDMTRMQRFYYDLGRKEGVAEGVKKGYALALRDFRKIVAKNARRIRALEAGKYLIKEGKITYPKVYKVRNGDSYSIKIVAPTIEPAFSPEDLYIIPLLEGRDSLYASTLGKIDAPSPRPARRGHTRKHSHKNANALGLPDLNEYAGGKSPRPSKPSVRMMAKSISLPKNSLTRGFLQTYGAKYVSRGDSYVVTFTTEREKKRFCKEYSGDESCRGRR
jgi:hypothetical protein